MFMRWEDLVFLHWPVGAEALRPLIPAGLELETFEGTAWLGVVPFRMTGIRARGLPAVPGTDRFLELNVRTYVRCGGRAGVWFFSLDAEHPLAVGVARRWYHLNYLHALMWGETPETGWVHFRSKRTDARGSPAELDVAYRPSGAVFRALAGTFDAWCTERYCLYAADGRGDVYRGEIHHAPWPLQSAEIRMVDNTMGSGVGLELRGEPRVLFSRSLEVVAWGLERCG
jgi:uncharacterized protein YqjF (DUF2071 family)